MAGRRMVFVDGENLTIRAQELAREQDGQIGGMYHRDVCCWGTWMTMHIDHRGGYELANTTAIRTYYYTCMTGGQVEIDAVRDDLIQEHVSPVVVKKKKGQRAKGGDIMLTRDMLVHAFFDHYDFAVLVAGDGDYVPLVQEVKRFGKRVYVAFFDEKHGLNVELRRAADKFILPEPSFK